MLHKHDAGMSRRGGASICVRQQGEHKHDVGEGQVGGESGGDENHDAGEQPQEWPYWGWDPEHDLGWRAKSIGGVGRHAMKQTTHNFVAPTKPEPHMFMFAAFPDGQKYELSDLTVEMYELRQQARKEVKTKATATEPFWSAEHKASSLKVTIKLRVDRQVLVSMYHGAAQICQVPLLAFPDKDQAFKFMQVRWQFC